MSEKPETLLQRIAPGWSPELRAAIVARSSRIRCPDGAQLFGPGDSCENFLIPLSGGVRVEHMGATGRSVVLYRVGPGDSCVMTTSCLLSGAPYQAYGFAEGEVEALVMPAAAFHDLVNDRVEFRDLALSVFSQRIIDLVEVIDEFLLHRVDLRLAAWLADRAELAAELAADGATTIRATHQGISAELGTAREVVSRILKEFERRGWIALARGEVRLLDQSALRSFAAAR